MPMQKRPEKEQEIIKTENKVRAHLNTALPAKVFGHNHLSKSLAEYYVDTEATIRNKA